MRKKKKHSDDDTTGWLVPRPTPGIHEPDVGISGQPLWTENKAKLIAEYIYLFVQVTKHGTYIDGFAGPQEPDAPDTWAAKLVVDREPKWLRHFHLFDRGRKQIAALEALKAANADRDITVYKGDSNVRILELLNGGAITEKEATFCLLDQRTFECHWSTVAALARYKKAGFKIELFYFFANAWLDRALAAQRDEAVLRKWWGRDDWKTLRGLRPADRAELVVRRFKTELNYASVKPYAIYERRGGHKVMYFMIHATDHLAAPGLMARAYDEAVEPVQRGEQLGLTL